jgi:hypothetical protein
MTFLLQNPLHNRSRMCPKLPNSSPIEKSASQELAALLISVAIL